MTRRFSLHYDCGSGALNEYEDFMLFKSLVPMLQCYDIKATTDWYGSVLGFRCVGEMENGWCRLERDGVAIMFMRNDHLGTPQATTTQYIYVDDVIVELDQGSMPRRMGSRRDAVWNARVRNQGPQRISPELWTGEGLSAVSSQRTDTPLVSILDRRGIE